MRGFILAGGKSSRMGRDKALIELDGLPLIARVIAAVSPVVTDLTLIANDAATYAPLGLPIEPDRWLGAAALGGIGTAITHAAGRRALVLACDLPFVTAPFLRWLVDLDPAADVTLLETESDGFHPLCAVYSARCLAPIEAAIAAQRLKVTGFFPEVRVRVVRESELRAVGFTPLLLANLNTPAELEKARLGEP